MLVINLRRWRKKIGLAVVIGIIIAVLYSNWFWRLVYPISYKDDIFRYAGLHELDPYFVTALIKAESNFAPDVQSRRGARGIMQIMPETGRWAAGKMGLSGFNEDMLYNPQVCIRIGTWYLADLDRQFNGEEAQMAAAYNAGRGTVEAWIKEKRWSGTEKDINRIPYPETREFVRSVLHYKKVYSRLYAEES